MKRKAKKSVKSCGCVFCDLKLKPTKQTIYTADLRRINFIHDTPRGWIECTNPKRKRDA